MKTLYRCLAALVLAGFVWGSLPASPAHAATINVNETADELNGDGDCSLREAIRAANSDSTVDNCTAGSGADTIVLASGQTYTLSLEDAGFPGDEDTAAAEDDLDITTPITIQGNGATIQRDTMLGCNLDGTDAAGEFRIFEVSGSGNLTLQDVTVRNGCADGIFPDSAGGGILNDIDGTLTLSNSTLSDNSAVLGGGIYNSSGTVTITNSTLSGNSADGDGGGIANADTVTITNSTLPENGADTGGGIFNAGTLTLTDSTLSDNSAFAGGGIFNGSGGTATIANSTLSDNSAFAGGGIANDRGTLTIANSTLSGNSADISGGGIANEGTATIANSTLSGNSADDGGGIANGGTVTVTNSTLSDNSASAGGGIGNDGTATIKNSIVANSTSGGNCAGTITAQGVNFDTDGTCPSFYNVPSTGVGGLKRLLQN